MTKALTPEEARAAADKIDQTADRTRHLADPIAATLRAYADQSERLKEIERAVGEVLDDLEAVESPIREMHPLMLHEYRDDTHLGSRFQNARTRLRALQER